MDDNTIMPILIVGRLVAATAAIISAALLSFYGKEGWLWFLFAAIVLGCMTILF